MHNRLLKILHINRNKVGLIYLYIKYKKEYTDEITLSDWHLSLVLKDKIGHDNIK